MAIAGYRDEASPTLHPTTLKDVERHRQLVDKQVESVRSTFYLAFLREDFQI
jgi:hypothetical protein